MQFNEVERWGGTIQNDDYSENDKCAVAGVRALFRAGSIAPNVISKVEFNCK